MSSPSQAQNHGRYPLTAIFGNIGNVRVLRALVDNRAPRSAPELARWCGLSPQGVRLILDT